MKAMEVTKESYSEMKERYNQLIPTRTRAIIKKIIFVTVVLFLVFAFIALVIGLAVGLTPEQPCDNVHCNTADPCVGPCSKGACTYICPKLLLAPPFVNTTQGFTVSSFAVSNKLTLTSDSSILSATITISQPQSGDFLNITGDGAPSVSVFFDEVGSVLYLNSTTTGVTAATYQSVLRNITYTNDMLPNSTITNVVLLYQVKNAKDLYLPTAASASLYIHS